MEDALGGQGGQGIDIHVLHFVQSTSKDLLGVTNLKIYSNISTLDVLQHLSCDKWLKTLSNICIS